MAVIILSSIGSGGKLRAVKNSITPKKSAPFWMGKTNALRKPALAASARRVKDRSWPKSDSQAGLLSRQTRPGKLSPGAKLNRRLSSMNVLRAGVDVLRFVKDRKSTRLNSSHLV